MSIRKPDMTPYKVSMPSQPVERRLENEDEVALGYTVAEALAEAARCMDCPEQYCTEGCPAHTAIPEFIREIQNQDFAKAFEIIQQTNPFACIASRVCPYSLQCESRCTRGIKGEAVAIGRLERFVCDMSRESLAKAPAAEPSQRLRAASVGSGPAGLAFALTLARAGHSVTVYEKSDRVGGIIDWGIPSFVLPKTLLAEMIEHLEALDVEFVTGVEIGRDKSWEELRAQYDAVFIGVGAGRPVELDAGCLEPAGVIQAADYLAAQEKPRAKQVAVFGGGSTAIDAARAALRAGADRVCLIYRRTEDEMPATQDEIDLAREEGVEFVTLASPQMFHAAHGLLTGIRCERTEPAPPDYPGGRKNARPTGETFVAEADLAILALGFRNVPVPGVESDKQNRILTDEDGRTSAKGIYAGGDAVAGPSTLMKAAAAGMNAAKAVLGTR